VVYAPDIPLENLQEKATRFHPTDPTVDEIASLQTPFQDEIAQDHPSTREGHPDEYSKCHTCADTGIGGKLSTVSSQYLHHVWHFEYSSGCPSLVEG